MSTATDTAPDSTTADAPSSTGTADAVPFSRLVRERSGAHHGRVVSRQFGFDPAGPGASFYHFERISDPTAFKDAYRAQLDAAPWAPDEAERVVAEVLSAYDRNTRIFEQLAARA